MSGKLTRRVFLGQTAPAAIGAGLIGPELLASPPENTRGANDSMGIGLIGCGGRGRQVLRTFLQFERVWLDK